MGIFGKPDTQKLMEKRNIEGLTKALKDKDPMVRQLAIEYLGIIAAGGAYKEYPWACKDLVRERACRAISKAFLESEDVRVRMEAAVFLKSLYERGGLPKELKKAVGKIIPKLDEMFRKNGTVLASVSQRFLGISGEPLPSPRWMPSALSQLCHWVERKLLDMREVFDGAQITNSPAAQTKPSMLNQSKKILVTYK